VGNTRGNAPATGILVEDYPADVELLTAALRGTGIELGLTIKHDVPNVCADDLTGRRCTRMNTDEKMQRLDPCESVFIRGRICFLD
jgi:hypothetical protein